MASNELTPPSPLSVSSVPAAMTRGPRPKIILPTTPHIQANPLYTAGIPMTGNIPLTPITNPNEFPFHMYPTKASEFMFKQFNGFKDFTFNTAKSGMSFGEKIAFWMYNRVSSLSRQWFTHIFLFLVITVYSVCGALMFVAIEGRQEDIILRDMREERYNILRLLNETFRQNLHATTDLELAGSAYKQLVNYEKVVKEYYENKSLIANSDGGPKVWTFLNAIFYCGTIYTTIEPDAGKPPKGNTAKIDRPKPEVESLLSRAKSVANTREKPMRMRRDKKLLIRRSQSAGRENYDDALVEDFKRAQLAGPKTEVKMEITDASQVQPKTDESQIVNGKLTVTLTEVTKVAKPEEPNPDSVVAKPEVPKPEVVKPEAPKTEQKKRKESKPLVKPAQPRMSLRELYKKWKLFTVEHHLEYRRIMSLRNRCLNDIGLLFIFCGLGGIIFKFTEGAFENFYKCGVKRVKRDFIDALWRSSHNLREDDWKSLARRKLKDFEEQLHTAHEAGVQSYSGQRSWSFLNGVVYALTVVTTIGYGHMYPTTTTGRALTIVYALIGIPLFLIILTDFGKLFTRAIKFVWAFVRRLYYTGSCKKIRRTTGVQEVFKGAHMMYEIATFRRPSHYNTDEEMPPDPKNLQTPNLSTEPPNTPAPSTYQIDDEFNLPISVAILILVIYIFLGALIYHFWEDWDFFASFYFVFISMSTIGFGDFVPANPLCMIVSIIYLVFGLALMSMCINVVQAKISDTFRQASAKLGATIGLTVAEEDGSITTVPPPAIEIADVHGSNEIKPQTST